MTLYPLALFLHVVGALLLFVTLTVEGIGLRYVRRATTLEQVREWATVAALTRVVGPFSAGCIVIPGLYMVASSWGWVGWIVVGLAGWLLIAVLGAVSGVRLAGAGRAASELGSVNREVVGRLRDPWYVTSWLIRVAIALGIVFLMTVKPQPAGALLAISVCVALGAAAGSLASRATVPQGASRPLSGEQRRNAGHG